MKEEATATGRQCPHPTKLRGADAFSALRLDSKANEALPPGVSLVAKIPQRFHYTRKNRICQDFFQKALDKSGEMWYDRGVTEWGVSAVGSAQHWQCWGQGFESPTLHQESHVKAWDFSFSVFLEFVLKQLLILQKSTVARFRFPSAKDAKRTLTAIAIRVLELAIRVELMTSSLPMTCSTN